MKFMLSVIASLKKLGHAVERMNRLQLRVDDEKLQTLGRRIEPW